MKLTMKTSLLSIGLSLAAGSAILLACSPINAASSSSASAQATVDGVKTAKWGDNVKINFADDSCTFTSNGIPNHARPAEYVLPNAGVMLPTPITSYVGADPTKAQDAPGFAGGHGRPEARAL